MEKLDPATDGQSMDLTAENLKALETLFPEAFREGMVDFDVLREVLGDAIDDRAERYGLSWNGKSEARRIAQMPSAGTLRPVPEESVDWDTTGNLFIEGDNLEVLKLLQKSYHRRVKMIYIDPPYNTGNEFIYPDRYEDNLDTYLRYTGQVDDSGFHVSANPETSGRFHTKWLNMMYPRLKLARNLLSEDGLIFVSCDDGESHNLRHLLDEVFGPEHFVASIAWEKRYTRSNNARTFYSLKDSIQVYRKSEAVDYLREARTEKADEGYTNPDGDPRGPWASSSYVNPATKEKRRNLVYDIQAPDGRTVSHPTHAWKYSYEEHQKHVQEDRLWWGESGDAKYPRKKIYLDELEGMVPVDLWDYKTSGTTDEGGLELKELFGGRAVFDNPKPTKLIQRMLGLATDADSHHLVLDFFGGSGSTGDAVLRANKEDGGNRRYILVQLPEPTEEQALATISEIAKERLRRVGEKIGEEARSRLPGMPGSAQGDVGFRAFKLDSSNIKPWDASYDNVEGALQDSIENIKADRSEADVLYELLLKYGLDLAMPVEEKQIAGRKVYVLGAGALVVCLAGRVGLDVVEGIAALKDELQPEVMRVVFRDSSFEDDVVKTNAVQILRQAGVDDVKSL